MKISLVLPGRLDRESARFPQPKEPTTNCGMRSVNAELLASFNEPSRQLRVCQGTINGIPVVNFCEGFDNDRVSRLVRSPRARSRWGDWRASAQPCPRPKSPRTLDVKSAGQCCPGFGLSSVDLARSCSVVVRDKVNGVVKDDRDSTLLRCFPHSFQEARQLAYLRLVFNVFSLRKTLDHDWLIGQQLAAVLVITPDAT